MAANKNQYGAPGISVGISIGILIVHNSPETSLTADICQTSSGTRPDPPVGSGVDRRYETIRVVTAQSRKPPDYKIDNRDSITNMGGDIFT